MPKIGYVLRTAKSMNISKMLGKVKETSAKSGKLKIIVFFDMIYCGFRYQAGYMDYALFEMYSKNKKQRLSTMTRGKNNRYVSALNDRSARSIFENKIEFHKAFSGYTKRGWLDLSTAGYEEFEAFIDTYGDIIVKPPEGIHGDGISRLSRGTISDRRALYDDLIRSGQTLCEELVVQHDDLNRVYPGSVNTVRMVTILTDKGAELVAAMHRIGSEGSAVDNFNNGGMVVPVNVSDGVVYMKAIDKAGRVYEKHPSTGEDITGMKIPLWDECLAFVKDASTVVPQVRYVGWDVAVTPNGPLLIEGNWYPGHDIYGLPPHTPDGVGVLPTFEAVIPLKSLKDV